MSRKLPHRPVSERAAYEESVWLPHRIFLGSRNDTAAIAGAVLRVCENIKEVRGLTGIIQEARASNRRVHK